MRFALLGSLSIAAAAGLYGYRAWWRVEPLPAVPQTRAAMLARPAKLIWRVLAEGAGAPVRIAFTVTREGKVHDPRVVAGEARLAEAALRAIREWHYRPAMRSGQPVESEVTAEVDFAGSR